MTLQARCAAGNISNERMGHQPCLWSRADRAFPRPPLSSGYTLLSCFCSSLSFLACGSPAAIFAPSGVQRAPLPSARLPAPARPANRAGTATGGRGWRGGRPRRAPDGEGRPRRPPLLPSGRCRAAGPAGASAGKPPRPLPAAGAEGRWRAVGGCWRQRGLAGLAGRGGGRPLFAARHRQRPGRPHLRRGAAPRAAGPRRHLGRCPGSGTGRTGPGEKMIHSLFLINCSGDIFLEKHWKSVVSQSVCDYFFEAQEKAIDVENVPPVISTPHHYLISIYRDKIFFVSVIQTEVPPLFVIEFLHRVADTFQDYFGECSETAIKDNVVIVYELLEEMLDNGFPLATESNILKELIKPPTILRSVVNSITGSSNVGDTLPTGQLSNIPWRRAGVKYTNNEAYFDVIEEIDAIIDKSGSTVFAEIQGVIDSCIKLSGMPDLSLSFMNPRLLDDVSFHPCIRFKRWESERVLSFIPPDGNFRLISYRVSSQNLVAIPVYVKHVISFKENSSSGRFDVTIGPKQNMGKTVEGVVMTVHMPKAVLNMNLTSTQGSYTFDPVTKVLTWDVGKITPQKLPNLKGIVNLQSGAPKPEENPSLNIQFKIQQLAISGLKVNRLDMYGEKYKPFKGVKYITKAGKFQVRT